jgi:serine protease Do
VPRLRTFLTGRGISSSWIARVWLAALLLHVASVSAVAGIASPSYAEVINDVQPRMVKIFGAGGLRNLESYQSGFLISPDGFILTAWSYVLDTDQATVILDDGRKFVAEIVGADPRSEIAVLKVEATDLPHFVLSDAKRLAPGARVLTFSNLYGIATGDEATSVLHGLVSAVTQLNARRGSFETPYRGSIYVLDAMTNNAGAAGGALTDSRGNLAGVLGKELRDAQTNIWLNYSIPIDELRSTIESIVMGKAIKPAVDRSKLPKQSVTLDPLGLVLSPKLFAKTPPFVDLVRPGSAAAKAGVRTDDLIVLVGDRTVSSQAALHEALMEIDVVDAVRITVIRRSQLLEFEIEPP